MIKGIINATILVSVVIISMMFIYGSISLFLMPGWSDQFAVWGYSQVFMYIIATIEMVLGIAVFAPVSRTYGLLGVIVIMIGAIYTHLTNDQPEEIYAAIFVVGLSLSTLILSWQKKNSLKMNHLKK